MGIIIHNDPEDTNWSVTTITLLLEKKLHNGLVLSCDKESWRGLEKRRRQGDLTAAFRYLKVLTGELERGFSQGHRVRG